ncbi:MAG: metallophosphoesterase [Solirubrobacteraceae bacterium]|nr:metallophosphoesterase [Solirubrobacteraceae bacterium]
MRATGRTILRSTVVGAIAAATFAATGEATAAVPERVVLNPTERPETSQTITWRTPAADDGHAVEIRRPGEPARRLAGVHSHVLRDGRHHTVTANGLLPDHEYEYRVGKGDDWTAWTTFRTAAKGHPGTWRWLYNGDTQEGLDTWTPWIRRSYADVPDARLVIHAGDLINAPNQDEEWAQWFGAQKGVLERINTLAIPGNHEYLGTMAKLPFVDHDGTARSFRAHFNHPLNGPAGLRNTAYTVDYQGIRFIALNTGDNMAYDPSPQQREWLRGLLRDNPNRWTVVILHIPFFSSSDQHHSQSARVRASWLDLVEQANVDLVLQGHTHSYARGHVGGPDGPQYVVSTSGPKYYELGEPGADWKAHGATPRLVVGETSTYQEACVTEGTLALRSVITGKGDATTTTLPVGATLDAFTIHKDGRSKRVTDGYECAPTASAPTGPAPDALLRCTSRDVVIGDVRAGARRDLVRAVAAPDRAGDRAVLRRRTSTSRTWRTVARATVGADGRITLRARRTSAPGARYRVDVGAARSVVRTRTQPVRITGATRSGARMRVRGVARGRARVRIQARSGCGAWTTVARVRADRDGRWDRRVKVADAATVVRVDVAGARRGARVRSIPAAIR